LAGGGVKNQSLTRAIQSCSSSRVERIDHHGLPASYREAACFGVLGALCHDRVAITLPAVTGVRAPAPVAGCWTTP
jgi:1,6-anhydro-N-acetylmuramate kinase